MIFSFLFTSNAFSAQINNSYFKVEFDAFTPPQKAMIESVEGKPAKNFVMKDLNGIERNLTMFKGKKIVLWFWDEDIANLSVLENLNNLSQLFPAAVFISMYNNPADKLPDWFDKEKYQFYTLPNAAFLGEAVYDAELGSPRVYLISEDGNVKMVMPKAYFENAINILNMTGNFLNNKLD